MKRIIVMNKKLIFTFFVFSILFIMGCKDNSHPGYEYMPNMYNSPSIETYEEHVVDQYDGTPVKGTVAMGYKNLYTNKYTDTITDYLLSGENVTYPSDFEKNTKNLDDGKELYSIFCAHCHGDKGEGGSSGKIKDAAGIYSEIPSYKDNIAPRRSGGPMSDLREGHMFHAITYGYNAMGPHASLISEEERWKIIYYIKEELQK